MSWIFLKVSDYIDSNIGWLKSALKDEKNDVFLDSLALFFKKI